MYDDIWESVDQFLRQEHANRQPGSPRRKRGGQPGNQNARKHGLVEGRLTREQRNNFRAIRRAGSLSPDLDFLRVKVAALLTDPRAEPEALLRAARLLVRLFRIELRPRRR